jgi:hypothetical protein
MLAKQNKQRLGKRAMNRESTGKMNHKRNTFVQARLQTQRKDLGKLRMNLWPQQQTIRRIGRVR